MDDIIFEKDYRETESVEYDKWCDEVFDRAVNGGMLKAYSEAMDKIPKIDRGFLQRRGHARQAAGKHRLPEGAGGFRPGPRARAGGKRL